MFTIVREMLFGQKSQIFNERHNKHEKCYLYRKCTAHHPISIRRDCLA